MERPFVKTKQKNQGWATQFKNIHALPVRWASSCVASQLTWSCISILKLP